jgi:hypothetical protein
MSVFIGNGLVSRPELPGECAIPVPQKVAPGREFPPAGVFYFPCSNRISRPRHVSARFQPYVWVAQTLLPAVYSGSRREPRSVCANHNAAKNEQPRLGHHPTTVPSPPAALSAVSTNPSVTGWSCRRTSVPRYKPSPAQWPTSASVPSPRRRPKIFRGTRRKMKITRSER